MIGTLKINAWMGFVAFVITFITAFVGNIWSVSLERALIAFLLFFLAAFPVRLLLGLTIPPDSDDSDRQSEPGQHVDLVAGNDQSDDEPKPSENEPFETFTPLVPPRIERKKVEQEPIDIANMIRRLTDE